MGTLISLTAEIRRVEKHIRSAHTTGKSRGGEIASAAEARLGPAVAMIDAAKAVLDAAKDAEEAAWFIVIAMDKNADSGIGATRDAMWNALGRPKQSPSMVEVYPGGVGTYTDGDVMQQPLLMQVLHARILAASAPQWTEAKRVVWAAEIEALRVPYAAAVDAFRPIEAAALVAEAGYRAAVRSGHARLGSFKRDLKSLGLTEAQIHEIIPDAGAQGKSGGSGGEGGDGGEGGEETGKSGET